MNTSLEALALDDRFDLRIGSSRFRCALHRPRQTAGGVWQNFANGRIVDMAKAIPVWVDLPIGPESRCRPV